MDATPTRGTSYFSCLLRDLHNVNRTVWNYHYGDRLHLYGFSIMPTLLRPKSRGSVTLNSADPREPPHVDLNYFADERDVKVLTEGIKMAVEFADTRAFREKGVTIMGPDKLICGEFLSSDKGPDSVENSWRESW